MSSTQILHTRRGLFQVVLAGSVVAGAAMTSPLAGPVIGLQSGFEGGTPAATPKAEMETIEIRTIGLRFEPARITIPAHVAVRLRVTNESAIVHDLVIPSVGKRTSRLRPAESDDLVLRLDPGRHAFNCSIQSHWQAGMEGELIVE